MKRVFAILMSIVISSSVFVIPVNAENRGGGLA